LCTLHENLIFFVRKAFKQFLAWGFLRGNPGKILAEFC
jgi:hypothetical protein